MLEGKNAIVTGASQGIGFEISKLFIKNGASVIGITDDHKNWEEFGIDFIMTDVKNSKECETVFNRLIKKYTNIDILVNCAGITRDALTGKMTEKQWDEVIDVNLKGVWNMVRFVGPHMQKRRTGSIINIASIVGISGNIGQANYAASKAGIIGLTKTWAKEFSYRGGNVRVNAIAPGYTNTRMLDTVPKAYLDKIVSQIMLGRLAEPREIAEVALFLASEMSSYVTGSVIQVDGGLIL